MSFKEVGDTLGCNRDTQIFVALDYFKFVVSQFQGYICTGSIKDYDTAL